MAATFKVRSARDIAFNAWVFKQMGDWAGAVLWLVGVGAFVGIFAGSVYGGWHIAMGWLGL